MRVGPLQAAEAVLAAARGGSRVAVVLLLEGPTSTAAPGARLLLRDGITQGTLGDQALDRAAAALAEEVLRSGGPSTRTVRLKGGAATLYAEAHGPIERLVIVGAGHISVPLAQLGAMLGFRVTVLDDREEFTSEERFPAAAEVRRVDFRKAFDEGGLAGAESYVVLVTRGHRYDVDCLRQLLARPELPRYVGLIGSRRRVRAALSSLLRAGVPRERLSPLRAPVGLDLGGETPEEIALSIAAEVVAARRGVHDTRPLSARERVLERLLPDDPEAAAPPEGGNGAEGPGPGR